jgi:hypothetical protein
MTKDLIIEGFEKGIAPSPHVGFGDFHNVDIHTIPGSVRLNRAAVKDSATTVTDLIKWMAKSGTTYYALGDTGKLYSSVGTGAWAEVSGYSQTNAHGNGLAVWKDYLIIARDGYLDAYGPLSGTPAMLTDWKAIPYHLLWHPMIAGQDDILYIGADRYVGSLQEVVGQTFDPGNSATYSWNDNALDLPTGYSIKCMAELGTNLMLGTIKGNDYSFGGESIADIFPWDRTSDTFTLPLRLNTTGVHQMVIHENVLYIVAGRQGDIYATNGTSVKHVAKLPHDLMFETDFVLSAALNFYPGAILSHNDRVYIGASTAGNSDSLGVWSLKDGVLVFEHEISTGTTSDTVTIGSLYPSNSDGLLIGWADDATYGLDLVNYEMTTGYVGYFDTPLYFVGTPYNPKTYTTMGIVFAKPLTANQGVRVSYRKNLHDDFTEINTWDGVTHPAALTIKTVPNISDAVNLQLRVALNGPNGSTPEFKTIILS